MPPGRTWTEVFVRCLLDCGLRLVVCLAQMAPLFCPPHPPSSHHQAAHTYAQSNASPNHRIGTRQSNLYQCLSQSSKEDLSLAPREAFWNIEFLSLPYMGFAGIFQSQLLPLPKVKVKVTQLYLTLWVRARILEWVALSVSRGSSQPRDRSQVSRIAHSFFTSWATREAQEC